MSFLEQIKWYPGIGDPSFLGWFTVVAYGYVAFLCYSVARNGVYVFTQGVSRQVNLWAAIALIFVALAINKQLDLQTFFTATAKYFAKKQGWYGIRREFQAVFIIGVIVIGFSVLVGLLFNYRKYLWSNFLALIGLCFVICFIVIRASSFHHIDRLIGTKIAFIFSFNHLLELSGIFLVGANALWLLNQRRRPKQKPTGVENSQ